MHKKTEAGGGSRPPDPAWDKVTAEQAFTLLLSMQDGKDEKEMERALRAMPQKETDGEGRS